MRARSLLWLLAASPFVAGCISDREDYTSGLCARESIITASQERTRAYVREADPTEQISICDHSIVWDKGDRIGVFLTGPTDAHNTPFTSESGTAAEIASFIGQFDSPPRNGNYTYYAYSPYSPVAGDDPRELHGTIEALQIQSDRRGKHIGKNLLEVATASATDTRGARMEFSSLFTVINIRIGYDVALFDTKGWTIDAVRLFVSDSSTPETPLTTAEHSLAGDCTFNILERSVERSHEAYSPVVECRLEAVGSLEEVEADSRLDVWMVVYPVEIADKRLSVEVLTNRGRFLDSYPITTNGGRLMGDALYRIPITLNRATLRP